MCRIFGFRIDIRGQMSAAAPTLFIVNHASYIDIEILGSVIPASFVAKTEVATWPLFGTLARLQRTVFVDRTRRTTAAAQRDTLTERLNAHENVILFPEGTSSDGNRLKPFKSALFAAAEIRVGGQPVNVQPVTIAYVGLGGIPVGRTSRHLFAWYGDMALVSHMWRLLGLEPLSVCLQFHPCVTIDIFGSRKKLAEHCEKIIAEALSTANSGRLPAIQDPLSGDNAPADSEPPGMMALSLSGAR